MNTNSSTYRNFVLVWSTAWLLIVMLLSLAAPFTSARAATLAIPATDGAGTMTVSPTSVVYGSAGNTLTFTFTAVGDFGSGSSIILTIPAGWTTPTVAAGAGHTFVTNVSCNAGLAIGITAPVINVDITDCADTQSFTVTYANVTDSVISASPYMFATATDIPGGNGPTGLNAGSPFVAVTPAPLTVSGGLAPANKVYDGNPTASLTIGSPTLVGKVGSDVVTLDTSSASGAFDNKNVGTGKTVTITGLTLAGANAGNYTLIDPTRTANITPLPITINAVTDTKTYDATLTSSGLPTLDVSTPLASGDSEPAWTQTFDTKNVGIGKTLTPAGLVNDTNSGLNYSYNYLAISTGVINQLPITVTAATDTKVYDGTNASSGLPTLDISTPLASGDGEPIWTQTFDTKDVNTSKTLTPAGAVGDGNGGANYLYNFVSNATGEITAKPITVTALAKSKAYGAADPALTYTVSPALYGDDSFSGGLTRDAGAAPGVYAINQGSLTAGLNYAITYVGADLTINPKISGSAGVSGVTLKYNDGGLKSIISGVGGTYSLVVSYGWTGSVTPTKSGYIFIPIKFNYVNVTSNQVGQNFVASTERAKNGGFNNYIGQSKIPQYWTAANFAATDGKSITLKKEGTASVKIAGAAGKTKTLTQKLTLSGTSGDKFTFSFWVKGTAVPLAGVCKAQVLLYTGLTLVTTKTINCITGTYGFQRISQSFLASGSYNKVVIVFTYAKSSGTVWFDAASLMR